MNRVLAGTLAGIVGTYAMTVAKEALFQRLPTRERYPMPPREITEAAMERLAGQRITDEEFLRNATLASHFAYGAGCGAAFSLLGLHEAHPVRNGIAFGLGLWAFSYLGWLPAAGILTPAIRHPRGRNALMIAVHAIWGGSTGHAAARLSRTSDIFGHTPLDRQWDRNHQSSNARSGGRGTAFHSGRYR